MTIRCTILSAFLFTTLIVAYYTLYISYIYLNNCAHCDENAITGFFAARLKSIKKASKKVVSAPVNFKPSGNKVKNVDSYSYYRQWNTRRKQNKSFKSIVTEYYSKRKSWRTSKLGDILFKNVEPADIIKPSRFQKKFTILIWKHFASLKKRHLKEFRGKTKIPDPLKNCDVKNCIFQSKDGYLSIADAVVVHLHRGNIPNTTRRNVKQRWIFLNDESPKNTFFLSKKKPKLKDLSNLFNWSMMYRADADIPVPYGRTIPRTQKKKLSSKKNSLYNVVPYMKFKDKNILVSILFSNCNKKREKLIKKFEDNISMDVYGKCAKDKANRNRCPGHFTHGCNVTAEYLFYLVLENSQCREYLTEKAFYHGYAKGAIPVIHGPPLKDCEALLPPNSFLHVDQFKTIKDLTTFMRSISKNSSLILSYHKWRDDFEIVNEHGYFGERSVHYCRICEALNYNDDKVSIYNETRLRLFLDPKVNCK